LAGKFFFIKEGTLFSGETAIVVPFEMGVLFFRKMRILALDVVEWQPLSDV
jgi:hypothetical protein